MNRWIVRMGLGAAAAATVVAGLASSAGAASAAPGLSGLSLVNKNSTGQAGYFAAPVASAIVKDAFKVPTVTGCTSTFTAVGLGADIFTGSTGVPTTAEVIIACQNGAPAFGAAIEVNGGALLIASKWTPQPGDLIRVSVSESATASKVVVTDVTQKHSFGKSSTGGTNSSLLVGIDTLVSSGATLPVPNFGTAKFTGGSIDGTTVKAAGGVAYNLKSSGVLKIATSALNLAGNTWKETFKHS
jgi:hypothetical protein